MATEPNDDADPFEEEDENEPEAEDSEITSDDRTWGILVHAVAFVGAVFPFANIIGPLIIWLIKKDESEFVDQNGKQAVNFQICWTIYLIIAGLSVFVLIGFLLLPLIILAWIVLVILATIRASNGEVYDYPLKFDLVK